MRFGEHLGMDWNVYSRWGVCRMRRLMLAAEDERKKMEEKVEQEAKR